MKVGLMQKNGDFFCKYSFNNFSIKRFINSTMNSYKFLQASNTAIERVRCLGYV